MPLGGDLGHRNVEHSRLFLEGVGAGQNPHLETIVIEQAFDDAVAADFSMSFGSSR